MHRSLIVVDDFLSDPMLVRATALDLEYPQPPPETYYPGRNSARPVLLQGALEQVSTITGERLEPWPTETYGRFRVALGGDEGAGDVHVDESNWSAILYLTLPEHCRGGTDFFLHIPTNSDHAPYTMEHLKDWGFRDYADFVNRVGKPHSKDPSKWERTMRVPMKFNRLVLLRPWLWHTASPGFGDSLETGRLVYLMFFRSRGTL